MSFIPDHSSFAKNIARSIFLSVSRLRGIVENARIRRKCIAEDNTVFLPGARVENFLGEPSRIKIGKNSRIAGQLLVFGHGGRIVVGDDCFVGADSRIWSAVSVRIGNRVLISHGVNIHDTNAHSLSAESRHNQIKSIYSVGHPHHLADVPDAPVFIEDDAWIGFNAVVLKGVTVGQGAVVGAASVVTKDVRPFSIVVGNPAREIGTASD